MCSLLRYGILVPYTMSERDEAPSAGSMADGLYSTLPGDTAEDGHDGGGRSEEEPLSRGAHVGRYTVLDRIGAGGMGVVYAAFDPQLDRRVALKVMHANGSSTVDSGGRARLLREAQAMAKLSHPNVITVHDVGTFDDRVFVAMEFIEGATLRDWFDSERRWSEIVDAFVSAGRGLAAAHAAGLVHRDFKPDNVLIGNDGRVLVMDFGLARQAAPHTGPIAKRLQEVRPEESATSSQSTTETRDLSLTRTGAMLGTPAYMSPEQHRGESIGPHADQFSFCVALYEGLYRERPFEGASMASLAINVLDGHVRSAPRDNRIPTWLRNVVLRGLSVDPEDRHPSMDALLAELQRDPPQARRPWLVAGIAVGLAGVITVAYVSTRSNRVEACKTSAQSIHEVWSPARKQALGKRFETLPEAYATATWVSMSRSLDRYADAWASVYDVRCTADALARQRRRPAHDDPGLLCLDDARTDLDRLLRLVESDAGLPRSVAGGVEAVQTLPPPAQCTTLRRNDPADERLRADESRRAELDDVHDALADGRVKVGLGWAEAAEDALARAQARASAADAPRLQAEALLLSAQARLQQGDASHAEDELRDAILLAAESGRTDVEAAAWILTMDIVALRQGLYDEGQRVSLGAQAAIARAGDDPLAQARLLTGLGSTALAQGSYDSALAQFERALQIQSEQLPASDVRLADTHSRIGAALEGAGRFARAAEHHKSSLSIREQVLGASHPEVARTLLRLASSLQGYARLEAVEGTLVRARMLLDPEGTVALADLPEPVERPTLEAEALRDVTDPVDLARCLDQLGLLRRAKEEFGQAAKLHARAVAILETTLGPVNRDVGYARVNLGLALADQRRHAEALPHLRGGLDVWTKALPPGHTDLGFAHLNLANSLWATGQAESAREHYALAKGVWETALGEDHPHLGYALTGLGRALLETGDPDQALPYLERAYELRDHEDEDELNIAEVSLLLGRAQYLTGRDQARALELIQVARDMIGAYEPTDDAGLLRVLTGGEHERFTDQLVPAGLGVNNRYRPG
ncbi:MAG: serine/threonine-protein kinase [Myxococcota bacterium]